MHVTVCVCSRDENPRREAFEYVRRACDYAGAHGVPSCYGKAFSPHTVDHARNRGVAGFLESESTHVLMVDDDVLVPVDTIIELLRVNADVAGGCYPGIKRVDREFSFLAPCVLIRIGDRWAAGWFDGVLDATAVAGGCMLIRRGVFEKVGFPWFRWPQEWDEEAAEIVHKSDDVDFCSRALAAGCTIKAHGGVRCSHLKQVDLSLFTAQPHQAPWVPRWRGPVSVAEQNAFPAYGSHIPVLHAVGKYLNGNARNIVEYGSGKYSTPVFCDRRFFEHAESVTSYESDPRWMEVIQGAVKDERLQMYLTPVNRMAESIHEDADVVLIDCDYSAKTGDRFETRRELIKAYENSGKPVVIVHDSNFKQIQPAVESSRFLHKKTYTPDFGPQTTLLSNSVRVEDIEPQSDSGVGTTEDLVGVC